MALVLKYASFLLLTVSGTNEALWIVGKQSHLFLATDNWECTTRSVLLFLSYSLDCAVILVISNNLSEEILDLDDSTIIYEVFDPEDDNSLRALDNSDLDRVIFAINNS